MRNWGIEPATDGFGHGANLRESVEAAAFWAAILFPGAYVPLLAAGLDNTDRTAAFVLLVGLHFLLLGIGHAHER